MKKIAITQSNYIPWIGYFELIDYVDEFIFFDEVQYTRRDWRNRNKIQYQGNVKWLTIPLKSKGNYFKKISEIRTYDNKWKIDHINKIYSYYKKFNDFEKNFLRIQNIYKTCSQSNLSEINKCFIKEISKILNINANFQDSINFKKKNFSNASERLLEICRASNASVYVSGSKAKNYLNSDIFKENNIKVEWFEYNKTNTFKRKNNKTFNQNLSVIDYIFNFGLNKDFLY